MRRLDITATVSHLAIPWAVHSLKSAAPSTFHYDGYPDLGIPLVVIDVTELGLRSQLKYLIWRQIVYANSDLSHFSHLERSTWQFFASPWFATPYFRYCRPTVHCWPNLWCITSPHRLTSGLQEPGIWKRFGRSLLECEKVDVVAGIGPNGVGQGIDGYSLHSEQVASLQ